MKTPARRFLLTLPALLCACTMSSGPAPVKASQGYSGASCVQLTNAVAAAAGAMAIPDPDFPPASYRFAERNSTELTLYAQGRSTSFAGRRETVSTWRCVETGGTATLSVETSGLDADVAARLHRQFFGAVNSTR